MDAVAQLKRGRNYARSAMHHSFEEIVEGCCAALDQYGFCVVDHFYLRHYEAVILYLPVIRFACARIGIDTARVRLIRLAAKRYRNNLDHYYHNRLLII